VTSGNITSFKPSQTFLVLRDDFMLAKQAGLPFEESGGIGAPQCSLFDSRDGGKPQCREMFKGRFP